MENEKKLSIKIPSQALINPAQLRERQIQEEEEKRFKGIADKLLEVLSNEGVMVREIARVMSVLTNKINQKFDNSSVENILKI